MEKRIRLLRDLPVGREHGCLVGKEYSVVKEYRKSRQSSLSSRGRLYKVEFIAESGVRVCAWPSEFEWI
jgi:hypothetical protein